MFSFLKKHKIIFIAVSVDMFLYWLLFLSGIVLPFINPSIAEYPFTSAPRGVGQMLMWEALHIPTSLIFEFVIPNMNFQIFSIVQTGIIAYFIERLILRKKVQSRKTIVAEEITSTIE